MTLVASAQKSQRGDLVVVVATGGTIAQSGGRTATTDAAALISASGAEGPVEAVQLFQVTSPNIRTDHWLVLAKFVKELTERRDIAGIVITHGTDTLEETAFFLDLTIRTDMPVVVVGAMRPSSSPESDGEINLRDAIAMARSSGARGRGVIVILNGVVQAARDVTKRHSTSLQAFESPNRGPLGHWRQDADETLRTLPALPLFSIPSQLPVIPIVYFHVGLPPQALDPFRKTPAPGIIWAGTGAGSIPDIFVPTLAELAAEGTMIVRASRTGAGSVVRNDEVDDDAHGFLAAGDLTPQKASILLMLCIASGLGKEQIQRAFAECSKPA